MTAIYINHLTITTGHLVRTSRADVRDDVLTGLAVWLRSAIDAGAPVPMPVPDLSHYSARVLLQDGALVLTVYGPAGPHQVGRLPAGETMPLITLGVAKRSRHGAELWRMMVSTFGAAPGVAMPDAPWLAVALHPTLAKYPDSAHWLGDFERCVAWAWITRNPDLQAAS